MNHTYFQFCKQILKDKVKSVGRYFSSKWPIRVRTLHPHARFCVGQSFHCVCESLTHTPTQKTSVGPWLYRRAVPALLFGLWDNVKGAKLSAHLP